MSGETIFISSVRAATASLVAALADYDAANAQTPPASTYSLVLVGDSRLNGDWNALLGRTNILNLSVAGSKATDWLANWQANVQTIKDSGAKKVIVQYGKNDVDAGKTAAVIAHDIQDIVSLIGYHAPGVRVGVLGTLPVSATYQNASTINQVISQLNSALPNKVATASPVGVWHQGFQSLVDNWALVSSATDDGSHLNATAKSTYKTSITALEAAIP